MVPWKPACALPGGLHKGETEHRWSVRRVVAHAPVVSSCVYIQLLCSREKYQETWKCLTLKHLAAHHFKATTGLKLWVCPVDVERRWCKNSVTYTGLFSSFYVFFYTNTSLLLSFSFLFKLFGACFLVSASPYSENRWGSAQFLRTETTKVSIIHRN